MEQSAVEPFDPAVGLGPVGPGAFVDAVGVAHRLGPLLCEAIDAVFSQHSVDDDVLDGGRAPARSPDPNSGNPSRAFVGSTPPGA